MGMCCIPLHIVIEQLDRQNKVTVIFQHPGNIVYGHTGARDMVQDVSAEHGIEIFVCERDILSISFRYLYTLWIRIYSFIFLPQWINTVSVALQEMEDRADTATNVQYSRFILQVQDLIYFIKVTVVFPVFQDLVSIALKLARPLYLKCQFGSMLVYKWCYQFM